MGHKTFTCSVCGKEGISKKKSYALSDKTRACRDHKEAQEAKKSRDDKEKRARASQQEPRQNDRRAVMKEVQWAKSHCWMCGTQIQISKEWFDRLAAAIDIVKDTDFRNEKYLVAVCMAGDFTHLPGLYVSLKNDELHKIASRLVRKRMTEVVLHSRSLLACPLCVVNNNLRYENPNVSEELNASSMETMIKFSYVINIINEKKREG